MADTADTLTDARRLAGKSILDLTDSYGFDAYAAGWLHEPDGDRWRFLLITPMLRSRGPAWVYRRLLTLFRHHPLPEGISPLDIQVIDPEIEGVLFGPALIEHDDREVPAGLTMVSSQPVHMGGFASAGGTVFFYRRLPPDLRAKRPDAASRFARRVAQLEAA